MTSEEQCSYKNNNNNNNMKDIRDPKWILDRRNSGRLFWRRDSGKGEFPMRPDTTDESSRRNRVKFRYDVEVLEFWKQEYEQESSSSSSSSSSDDYSDEDDCYGFRGGGSDGGHDRWRSKHPWRTKHDATDVATPSTYVIGFLLTVFVVVVLYQWMNEADSVAVA